MAFIQTKRAGMGELLTGTFAHLALIWREIAVYFGVFLVIGLISDALFASPDLAPLTAIIGLTAIPAYFAVNIGCIARHSNGWAPNMIRGLKRSACFSWL